MLAHFLTRGLRPMRIKKEGVKLSILVSMSFGWKYIPHKPTGVQRPYADRGGGAGSPPLYVPYAAAFWD